MLDGRVKTMHPKITGAILAIRAKRRPHGLAERARHRAHRYGRRQPLSVRKNRRARRRHDRRSHRKYRYRRTHHDPLRRQELAGRRHRHLSRRLSHRFSSELRQFGVLSRETNGALAVDAFRVTADYDRAISARLSRDWPRTEAAARDARYQIAPPHVAALWRKPSPAGRALFHGNGNGIAGCEQLHGKELSYNNLVDLDACWQLVNEFAAPAAAIIKHTNPGGCGENASLAEAYRQALACDPVSAFGGVIGSIAKWMRKPPAKSRNFLWKPSPRRVLRRRADDPESQEKSAPRAESLRRSIRS